MKTFILLASTLTATFSLLATAAGQDPVQVAPNIFKVVFENEHVRVLDVVMKPGDKTPMHSHPDYLTYAITATKVRFTKADGTTRDVDNPAGSCREVKAETHVSENTGTTEAHVLNIEFKK